MQKQAKTENGSENSIFNNFANVGIIIIKSHEPNNFF